MGRPASPRQQENEDLVKLTGQVHRESRGTYGSPRVHAELTLGLGLPVNLKRVARLMRAAGIQGLYRRRRRGCTVRDPAAEPACDLVERNFTVDQPNRLWITDITEHPTGEGRLYCAAVMDAYSRLVIGWSIAAHMRTELVTDALGMAIIRRQPEKGPEDEKTILHSDHGAQYTSWAFGQRLRAAELPASMGTVGDCYDNSMMESFWGTLQLDLLDTKEWQTREELANAILEWVECWYNPHRLHSSIGMHSPVTFEALHNGPGPGPGPGPGQQPLASSAAPAARSSLAAPASAACAHTVTNRSRQPTSSTGTADDAPPPPLATAAAHRPPHGHPVPEAGESSKTAGKPPPWSL